MANGQLCDGVGLVPGGRVFIMTADNVYREVHPVVVEAFAKNMVPSGIWLAAYIARTTVGEASTSIDKSGIIIDPTK